MPNQGGAQQSPFEIVSPTKTKKGGNKGIIVAILIVVFLILSVVAGVLLVRQRQLVQEKAAAALCPAAEACPYAKQPTLLRNCHPPEADGSPAESLCNLAGRVEFCGTQNFCCPSAGASWTTNMSACATPTPTPTATPTHTPTPTPTPTGAATPTPTASASVTPTPSASASVVPTATPTAVATATPVAATARPIPVTGTDWPTLVGAGLGVTVIVASILIAL